MRLTGFLTLALLATPFAGGPALANMCQADGGLTCATGMPIDGYCECTSHGVTRGGTVVASMPHRVRPVSKPNCTANPQAPGCPHS